MDLSDLLRENRVRKIEPDGRQSAECLQLAERDVSVARKVLPSDTDWAFSIAYNSMLQAGRALMFADGFRASSDEPHKAVVDYADAKLGAKFAEEVSLFGRLRVKRNKVVYEKAGSVSRYEAEHAIKTAEKFLALIRVKLKR